MDVSSPEATPSINWATLANLLNEHFSKRSFHPKAIQVLEGSEGRIGVACSGGADSLFLLLWAWGRFPALRERLCVLHYNHQLRGDASEGDAVFVAAVAASLGLAYQTQRSLTPLERIDEAHLRKQRLAFFAESGCVVILQGHHGDDVLETLLMRICRGSGVEGLAAPRPVHRHHNGLIFARPLLPFKRVEIRNLLKAVGICWREDASNASRACFRNRIRHDVIPALRLASSHHPVQGALRVRALLEEDGLALDGVFQALLPQICGESLDLRVMARQPRAVLRRVVQHWLLGFPNLRLSATAFDHLIDHLEQGQSIRLSAGDGFIESDGVCLQKKEKEKRPLDWMPIPWVPHTVIYAPGRYTLRVQVFSLAKRRVHQILAGSVDSHNEAFLALSGPLPLKLRLRRWKEGDRYTPLGAGGSKKLQDLFTDAKRAAWERRSIPLVCLDSGEIAWIPGFPPADGLKLTSKTTWALWLTCHQC